MANNTLIINDEEKKVLHTLLLDLSTRQIRALGIDEEVFSHMARKSVALNRDGKWPEEGK